MSFVEYRESVDYVWVLARAFDVVVLCGCFTYGTLITDYQLGDKL